jgi:RNA polymerase sigma-70 factor (ECF subfamily)
MYGRAPDGSFRAHGLDVLSIVGGRIARIVAFNDATLVATFGLPETFPEPPNHPSATMTWSQDRNRDR